MLPSCFRSLTLALASVFGRPTAPARRLVPPWVRFRSLPLVAHQKRRGRALAFVAHRRHCRLLDKSGSDSGGGLVPVESLAAHYPWYYESPRTWTFPTLEAAPRSKPHALWAVVGRCRFFHPRRASREPWKPKNSPLARRFTPPSDNSRWRGKFPSTSAFCPV